MIPLGVLASARHAAGGGGGLSYQFVTVTDTLTDVPIGDADADRIVIVAWMANVYGSSDPSSATIGGVSATIDHVGRSAYDEVTYYRYTAFMHAAVPTGTTATIDLSGAGLVIQYRAVAVWTVTGSSATVTDSDGASEINTTPTVLAVTAPTEALVLATANTGIDFGADTTWAGDLTEDFDALAGTLRSGASAAPSAGAVSTTVTLATGYSNDRVDMVAYQIGA